MQRDLCIYTKTNIGAYIHEKRPVQQTYVKTYTCMKRVLYIETNTETYKNEKRPTYRDIYRDMLV